MWLRHREGKSVREAGFCQVATRSMLGLRTENLHSVRGVRVIAVRNVWYTISFFNVTLVFFFVPITSSTLFLMPSAMSAWFW